MALLAAASGLLPAARQPGRSSRDGQSCPAHQEAVAL